MLKSWIRRLREQLPLPAPPKRRVCSRFFRPLLDPLECRLAPATVFTWTGNGSNNNWNNPDNWDDGDPTQALLPSSGDSLVFPATADPTSFNNIMNLTGNPVFESITFTGTSNNARYTITPALVNGSPLGFQIGAVGITNSSLFLQTIRTPITILSSGTQVNTANAFAHVALTGVLSGSGGLTKAGVATLELTGENTYGGQTFVNAGTLRILSNSALGATGQAANGTVVAQGATLELGGDIAVGLEQLNFTGFGNQINTGALRSLGKNSWAGSWIASGSNARIGVLNGTLTHTGGLSSPGGSNSVTQFEKTGAGTLELGGRANNTHAGLTNVLDGILVLQKSGSAQAINGPLRVVTGATVQWLASEKVNNNVAIEVEGGTLDLNGFTETIGPLTLDAATIRTGQGILILSAQVTHGTPAGPAGTSTISGNLSLGSSSVFQDRIFFVNNNANGDDLVISARISGGLNFTLAKQGTGTLLLSGANSYLGPTRVNTGILAIANDTALGALNSAITSILSGTTLEVRGDITVATEELHLLGTGVNGQGVLHNTSGDNTWQGRIVYGAGTTLVRIDPGTQFTHAGNTASSTTATMVRKVGTGRLVYSGNTNYLTDTEVAEGVLALVGASPAGSRELRVLHSATVELQNRTAPLSQQTNIALNGPGVNGQGALQLVNGTATVSSPIQLTSGASIGVSDPISLLTSTGVISGGNFSDLRKVGPGNLVLTVANSYTGDTLLNEGVLTIRHRSALGPGNATRVEFGSTLVIEGTFDVSGETLFLEGNGTQGQGPLVKKSLGLLLSSTTWTGEVHLSGILPITTESLTTLLLNGRIHGTGSRLVKQGPGVLSLGGNLSNTLSQLHVHQGRVNLAKTAGAQAVHGSVILQVGELFYVGDHQLTDTTDVTVESTGLLNLNGRIDTINSLFVHGGNVRTGFLTLLGVLTSNNAAGTPSLIDASNGELRLNGAIRSITVNDGPDAVDLAFTGKLAGLGSFDKRGGGRLVYRTPFDIDIVQNLVAGVVQFQATTPSNGIVTNALIRDTNVEDGAILELTGGVKTSVLSTIRIAGNPIGGRGALHGLAGNNFVFSVLLTANATIAVDSGSIRATGSPTLPNFGSAGASATDLIKIGTGVLEIGTTGFRAGSKLLIQAGTVLVNDRPVSGGFVAPEIQVHAGGTLGGSGEVGAITVHSQGTLAPGNSPGILTARGEVTFSPGAIFHVELNGTTPGSAFDQLSLPVEAHSIRLNGADLRLDLNFNSPVRQQYVILNNAGSDRLRDHDFFAQGAQIKVRSPIDPNLNVTFNILYNAGEGGNDIILEHDNTSPTFINRSITPSIINEGQTVTLTGTIVDPDPLDRFFLDVDWGDGIIKTFTFGPGATGTTVKLTHTYEDENDEDRYVVRLSWRDNHHFSNSAEIDVQVFNVAPSVETGQDVQLAPGGVLNRKGSFYDPGVLDTFTAFVNYGDGSELQPLKLLPNRQFHLHHRYTIPGIYLVTVIVLDDDGGVGVDRFLVFVPARGSSNRLAGNLFGTDLISLLEPFSEPQESFHWFFKDHDN